LARSLISLESKQALYRVAQEALHNIVKHARATMVTIHLTRQEGQLILNIGDNGRGFDPAGPFPGHLGMRSMQEGVTKIEGTLAIESAAGQGTHIHIRVPLTLGSE
jgi:signal transduction histidine kinase